MTTIDVAVRSDITSLVSLHPSSVAEIEESLIITGVFGSDGTEARLDDG